MATSDEQSETSPAVPQKSKLNSPTELWTTMPSWGQWVTVGIVGGVVIFLLTAQIITLVWMPPSNVPSKERDVASKTERAQDESKQTLLQIQKMANELESIRILEQNTQDIQAKIANLQAETQAFTKLTREQTQGSQALPKEVAKETGRLLGKVFRLNAGDPLNNLRTDVSQLTTTVRQLQDQFHRETAPRDVAIVVYHAKDISAYPLLGMINTLLQNHPYDKSYPRYRLGVYTASDNKVTPIAPLGWSSPKKAGNGKKPEKSELPNFSPSLSDRTQHTEDVGQLDVDQNIFGKAKSLNNTVVRKCVFVVSSNCPPPKATGGYKNTNVCVIIVQHQTAKTRPTNVPKHQFAWERFCRQHGGGAVSVTLQIQQKEGKSPSIPLADRQAFIRRLQWLISPL
ncbi:MAG: hypothetical protein ACFCD0_15035 [Gemmataceae bacterium]